MYYTDYTKKQIFADRQGAIVSSRTKAKEEFFDSLVSAHVWEDENGYPEGYIMKKVSDYKDIKDIFETYERNRGIVYEVKIGLESII